MWLALRQAMLRGQVEIAHPVLDHGARFGVRIEIHATPRGPRSAPAVGEPLIDGALSALHVGAPIAVARDVVAALASRFRQVEPDALLALARERDAVFPGFAVQDLCLGRAGRALR